jgi:hypothetical protein
VTLTLRGPEIMTKWWPALSPQIPGTTCGPLNGTRGPAVLTLPMGIGSRDARLLINACLHREHLLQGTISVHGVVVASGGKAVLLLGCHGAGKTMTALALIAAQAWRPVGGDTCLLRNEPGSQGVLVTGGTRSFMVRQTETRRWFADLLSPNDTASEFVDLARSLPPPQPPSHGAEPTLLLAALVRAEDCLLDCVRCDLLTARNAMYRASSHLIDKITDDPALDPLHLVETPALARVRVAVARAAATSVPCWKLRGRPHAMAEQILRLVHDKSALW